MLDNETKQKLFTARMTLVGKAPTPQAQVEQITIALIYKFMDDMDREVEQLGGKPSFFKGDFAQYSWSKIFNPSISGHNLVKLYGEAIEKMNFNPDIPQLFRDIFKNAYLPYKDPETLKSFLKIINEFQYSHSEKLGDAYEYLLSILDSQGDAGQFRTPRHIIDFIVEVVAPKKSDKILDPACGTAGFLISSYKKILKDNTKKTPGDKITPEERKKLIDNFSGYDISPDMIRMSLVNMYLHGFTNPRIYEYDTLTSEDRWNEYYDVILANPPFMSPKGGIKPHKKFSLQVNRSEVLFVDYICEHLTPNGKAGIIVPEGIIFQSGNAYKQLRKMLVEKYLWAVVSLPAGIFQPYSGVKTSILLIDKQLSKKSDNILFVKIDNDGLDLGAQRRAIEKNDLPEAIKILAQYREALNAKEEFEFSNGNVLLIEKSKIAEKEDYNLSIDRYRVEIDVKRSNYEMVRLGDISENITKGTTPTTNGFKFIDKGINFIKIESITDDGQFIDKKFAFITKECYEAFKRSQLEEDDILFSIAGALGRVAIVNKNILPANTNQALAIIRLKKDYYPKYIFWILKSGKVLSEIETLKVGVAQLNLSLAQINNFYIPLPPVSVQQELVSKIEGYQAIINGARQVVDNYKPQIDIKHEWEMARFEKVCEINPETIESKEMSSDKEFIYLDISSVENGTGKYNLNNLIKGNEAPSRARRKVVEYDVLLSTVRPNLKAFAYLENLPFNVIASTGFAVLRFKNKVTAKYVYLMLFSDSLQSQMISKMGKGSYPSINQKDVEQLEIRLPPIEKQTQIVERIEQEQRLVDANKELIKIYEQRIKDEINKVWEK